jgi:hypothetical protein
MERVSKGVFDALSLLKPYDIDVEKIRYGNDRDGCYILADIARDADIVSFGINDDVGFEMDMARQGRRVFLHDHTISKEPEEHELFDFRKKGICATGQSTVDLMPLDDHLATIPSRKRLILKMDVEGAEWCVLATASQAILNQFDQILIEFHWLDNLRHPEFCATITRALKNINAQFTLFHVHANNCRELSIVDGFAVADVIEVSYVRASLVNRRPSTTIYPSGLNKANHPDHHDFPLLFFPFLPMSVSVDDVAGVVRRIDAEQRAPA